MQSYEMIFPCASDPDIEYVQYNGEFNGCDISASNTDYIVVSTTTPFKLMIDGNEAVEGVDVETYVKGSQKIIRKLRPDKNFGASVKYEGSLKEFHNFYDTNFNYETTYWVGNKWMNKLDDPNPNFPITFWEGRNAIWNYVWWHPHYNDNNITPTAYHKFLFYVYKKSKAGQSLLSNFSNASQWITWAKANIIGITDIQIAEIWYTDCFQTPFNLMNFDQPRINFYTNEFFMNGFTYYVKQWINLYTTFKSIPWYTVNFVQITGSDLGYIGLTESIDLAVVSNEPYDDGAYGLIDIAGSMILSSVPDRFALPRDYIKLTTVSSYTEGSTYDSYKAAVNGNYWGSYNINTVRGISLQHILIHEVGHCVDFYWCELNPSSNNSAVFSLTETWANIFGATAFSQGNSWVGTKPVSGFNHPSPYEYPVTGYACENLREAFAEAFTFYHVNPDYLSTYFPKQYTVIRNLFETYTWHNGSNFETNTKIYRDLQPDL